jgi:hypothetical protein
MPRKGLHINKGNIMENITLKDLSKFTFIQCRKRGNGKMWTASVEFELIKGDYSNTASGFGHGENAEIALIIAIQSFHENLNFSCYNDLLEAFNGEKI